MLVQISNYLFLGSLFLLMVTLLYYVVIRKRIKKEQDFFFKGLITSYLFWISVAGIAISILITI